jgi:hypothetical protein
MSAPSIAAIRADCSRGVRVAPAGFEADSINLTQSALQAKYALNESSTRRLIERLPHDIAEQRRANSAARHSRAAIIHRASLTAKQKADKTKAARVVVVSKKRAGSSSPVNFGVPKPGMIAPLANSISADLMQALRRHPLRFSNVYNAGREHGQNGPYVAGFNRLPDLPALVAFCATLGIAA